MSCTRGRLRAVDYFVHQADVRSELENAGAWRRSWPRRERGTDSGGLCACSGWPRATKEGPGVVNVSVRTITDARRVGQCGCEGKCTEHASTRPVSMRLIESFKSDKRRTNRNMGSPNCSSNGGTVERGSAGAEDAGRQERQQRMRQRICRTVHENDKSKGIKPRAK